jgi:hypothetical protein
LRVEPIRPPIETSTIRSSLRRPQGLANAATVSALAPGRARRVLQLLLKPTDWPGTTPMEGFSGIRDSGRGRIPCRHQWACSAPGDARVRLVSRASNRDHGSERRLGFRSAPLLVHALIPAVALLALVTIPIALAFDAHLLHAELVSVAIGVGLT